MTATAVRLKPKSPLSLNGWKSALLALPMMLLSALMVFGGSLGGGADPLMLVSAALTWLFINTAFYLMLFTGETHRYRMILFIVLALTMIVTFSTLITQERGSNLVTAETAINGEVPFCHIVIPMVLLPAVLTRTIIFPGSMVSGFASIGSMLVLWIAASLALGKGWCSWVCFYGGLDEGFSRILRKPKIKQIDRKWTYLPYAVLLFIVLTSAITLTPVFCDWFCPYKTVTEYAAVTDLRTLIQAIIFVALFVGLVVVLPILTRRRTQCGLFCPFGAMQSFTNKVNAFDVRIDPEKCPGCKKCIQVCPTFSLDESSLTSGQTRISCTKCGQCIDVCPKDAIAYHIKGTTKETNPKTARLLFLYPAFIFFSAIGGGIISLALYRILGILVKLAATGSLS